MRTDTEFIIVGQGISGTLLSWNLLREGHADLIVIDNGMPASSSRVAAGVINPVTGRRIVQTWMIDTLLPVAVETYKAIGEELGASFISAKDTIDFFPSKQMADAFADRVQEGSQYLQLPQDNSRYYQLLNYDFGFGEITPCYSVNLSALLSSWKRSLSLLGRLYEEEFDASQLRVEKDNVMYKDIRAEKIIFCDGVGTTKNKWFHNLPFALNKGEALIIRNTELPPDHIFKKGITLAPLEDGYFWAGSSYTWDFHDADPSEAFRERTVQQLNQWLKSAFTVERHVASVRPATIERRPFVGTHPHHPRIAILNGMGTKGCSLAPFFARQLVDHLIKNAQVMPEADISRFSRTLGRPV